MKNRIFNFIINLLDRVIIELQGVKYSEYQNAIDEYNKLLLEPDDFNDMKIQDKIKIDGEIKIDDKIKQLKSGRDLLNERSNMLYDRRDINK